MGRISGNMFVGSDRKEIVATVWPSIEDFLGERGMKFNPLNVDILVASSVWRHAGRGVVKASDGKHRCGDRIVTRSNLVKELLKSRSDFIGGVETFGTHMHDLYEIPWGICSFQEFYVDELEFVYKTEDEVSWASFYIMSKEHKKAKCYNTFSEGSEPLYRAMAAARDASRLVVKVVSSSDELEKGIKKRYRELRREAMEK